MANPSHNDQAHHGGGHVTPIPVYLKTFVALLALMVLTIVAALAPYYTQSPFFDAPIGSLFNNVIAITIATAKALLVLVIFMGLRHSSAIARLYAIMGFVWFLLMFLMFADYGTRSWEPVRGWEPVPPQAMPRQRADRAPEYQPPVPPIGAPID